MALVIAPGERAIYHDGKGHSAILNEGDEVPADADVKGLKKLGIAVEKAPKAKLAKKAKKLDVEGRSDMTKDELAVEVAKAEGEKDQEKAKQSTPEVKTKQ